jgi:hypothetical protein
MFDDETIIRKNNHKKNAKDKGKRKKVIAKIFFHRSK